MKRVTLLSLLTLSVLMSCKEEAKTEDNENTPAVNEEQLDEVADTETDSLKFETYEGYTGIGQAFDSTDVASMDELAMVYETSKVGEEQAIKFKGKIVKVCKKKGCWATIALNDQDTTFVKFKDYAFFLPTDSEGSEVIMSGMAYKEETSVDELKHMAEDAGKSAEEIAKIMEPRLEYKFMADGVILEK